MKRFLIMVLVLVAGDAQAQFRRLPPDEPAMRGDVPPIQIEPAPVLGVDKAAMAGTAQCRMAIATMGMAANWYALEISALGGQHGLSLRQQDYIHQMSRAIRLIQPELERKMAAREFDSCIRTAREQIEVFNRSMGQTVPVDPFIDSPLQRQTFSLQPCHWSRMFLGVQPGPRIIAMLRRHNIEPRICEREDGTD